MEPKEEKGRGGERGGEEGREGRRVVERGRGGLGREKEGCREGE